MDFNSQALEPFRILSSTLNSIFYIPDYISQEEASSLHKRLSSIPSSRLTTVSGRRLIPFGGTVHERAGLIATALPDWLAQLGDRIATKFALYGRAAAAAAPSELEPSTAPPPLSPNHVLVNFYKPGEGIHHHTDGPLYLPAVAIVSLGAPALMSFRPREEGQHATALCPSVYLQPRSLLIFANDAYSNYMHGIDFVEVDRVDLRCVGNAVAAGLCTREEAEEEENGAGGHSPMMVELPRDARRSIVHSKETGAKVESSTPPFSPLDQEAPVERISLTIRRVLKVQSNLLRLGGKQ